MKKRVLPGLLALLLLFGCQARPDAHPEWGEELIRAGDFMAARAPADFALEDNNDALAPGGIYYLTWVSGQGQTITNEEGQEATVYDAQLYLLVMGCENREEAEKNIQDWLAREQAAYTAGEPRALTAHGRSFTLLPLNGAREGNPYTHGAAAFGSGETYAVSAELLCRDTFTDDPAAILEQFLQDLHY